MYICDALDNRVLQANKVSGNLQVVANQLEYKMKINNLNRQLQVRAEAEQLQGSSILPNAKTAPALQGIQRKLALNLAKSNLFHGLNDRPSLSQMKERGLYRDREEQDEKQQYYDEREVEEDYQQYEQQEVGQDYEYEDEQEEAYARQQQQTHGYPSQHPTYEYKTQQEQSYSAPESGYARRSKNFHLTRILLKAVNSWGNSGDFSLAQKGALKDLVVDQDPVILAVAEAFDAENDLLEFKDSLLRLTQRPSEF